MTTKSILKISSEIVFLTIQSKQKKIETENILINEENYICSQDADKKYLD